MSDPLTASALGAVPEVRRALAALGKRPERELSDEGLALLLAVRDATLSALARQPEEAVVEAAAQAIHAGQYNEKWDENSVGFGEKDREWYRGLARQVLAPERARIEALEKELADLKAGVR